MAIDPVPQMEDKPAEEQPVQGVDLFRRWAGLILGTLVLITCGLLAGKAMERIVTVRTAYDEVITMELADLYGEWRFAALAHQWAGAAQTGDAAASEMEGTVFGITEKSFLVSGGQNWSVENPRYILHPLEEPTGAFDDVRAYLGDEVLGYYAVLSEGGTVQPYRIYFSRDTYWVTSFRDNTADGSVILYDIYRIERAES